MVTLSEKFNAQQKSTIQDAREIASNNPNHLSPEDRQSLMSAIHHIRDHISGKMGLTGAEVEILLFYIGRVTAENCPAQLVSLAYPIVAKRPRDAITEADIEFLRRADKAIMGLDKETEHCTAQEKDIAMAYDRLRSDGLSDVTSLTPTAARNADDQGSRGPPSALSRASQVNALRNFESLDSLNSRADSNFDPADLGADQAQDVARFMQNNPAHFLSPTDRRGDKLPGLTKDPILPGYSDVR
ncbi:hypothetical protein NM208_g12198 [Fusarium decemcellulare]|uniref:Uncharacterized protein n=1 Tax=Fusarium decemcellulare TaxID=57161 RepID=A0ACC1RPY5_9HYPO|nr:hypothetical protein NM208_g12198 [Fusarium decemcellulare]